MVFKSSYGKIFIGVKMNIYKILNEMTLYIDENIEGIIDYETLAKMMGTNRYRSIPNLP